MVLTSLPLGVMAEELSEPTAPAVNIESSSQDSAESPELETTENPLSGASLVTIPEAEEAVQEPSQTMAAAETIETLEADLVSGFEFDVENNKAMITKCTNTTDAAITIPETLTTATGKVVPVTGIKAGAFLACPQLTQVTISPNVTYLDGASPIFQSTVKIYGIEGSLADQYATEKGFEFFKTEVFYVAGFESNQDSGITINTPVTLNAAISTWSKAIASYTFYYTGTDYNGDAITSVPVSGLTALYSFTPDKAGTYTFYVKVEDVDGNWRIKTIDNFEVLPIIKLEADTNSPQYVSTQTNLTADVDDGIASTAYDYEFSYQLGTANVQLQASSAANACLVAPDKVANAGAYTFKVAVKNQAGNTVFTGTKTLDFSFIDYVYVKSFTVDKLSPQEAGTALTLTAEAAGGKTTGYKYRFYYTLNEVTTEVDIQDYAETASVVFRPIEPGTYHLAVQVMNAFGVPAAPKVSDMKIISTPDGGFTAAKENGLPFYVDDTAPIKLTVNNPTGGADPTKPLKYKYYYALTADTSKTLIGTETTSPTMNCPLTLAKGTYNFYVEIIDEAANNKVTTTKTVTNYIIYDKFVDTGKLTPSLSSQQNKGTTIKLTASASGGKAPYTYAFSYLPPSGGETDIGEVSTGNTASLTMNDAGNYTIKVDITDANGVVETKTISYTINDNPQITKFETQAEIAHYINEDIIFTTEIEAGTDPYTYEFTGKMGTQTVWTDSVNKDIVAKNATATYTPLVAGTYTFTVKVTDKNGLSDSYTIKDYKVLPALAVKTLKTDKASGQNIGTAIKLTAIGTGGKSPYTYRFYYLLDGSALPEQLTGGNYLESSTAIFTPETAGSYTLYVDIKDANGRLLEKNGVITNYKVVNAPMLASYAADKDMTKGETGTAALYPGDTVKLKANTINPTGEGTTLSYQFFYKQGTTEMPIGTSVKTDPAKYQEATADFVLPDKASTYTVYVRVIDGKGSKDEKKIAALKVLGAVTAKAVKVSKNSGVIVGETVKLTASPTGGKSPYRYQFYYQKGLGAITAIDADPLAKTINYTFKTTDGSGDYTFYVAVTDDNNVQSGNLTTGETKLLKSASLPVSVTNPPQVSGDYTITAGGSALYAKKTTIALTAETLTDTGDGNLTYQFFYKQGATEMPIGSPISKTDPLTKYDQVTTDFKPDLAGSYTVYVRVSDGGGLQDVVKIGTFKILPGVIANPVKVSKNEVLSGESIKLTASGSGGQTAYNYQFYYEKNGDGVLKELGSLSEEKTKTVSFGSSDFGSGSYQFYVKITDKNNQTSAANEADIKKTISPKVTVTNPPNFNTAPSYEKTGTDPTYADLYVGDTVALKAQALDGSGDADLIYTFFYKQGTTEVKIGEEQKKTTPNEYEEATVDFKPTKSGSYTVYVRLTDGTSTSVAKIGTLKFLEMVTVKTVKASKTSGLIIGNQLKLTASGSGGKAPYQYQFYQIKVGTSDAPQKIGTASAAKTLTYTLPVAGTYTYAVQIIDANGVATEEITLANVQNIIKTDQVTIGNPPVIDSFTVTPEKGSPVYSGEDEEITLTAKLKADTGIDDLDWKFTYKVGTITKTVVPVVVGNVATAEIPIEDPGSYTFTVTVIDDNGSEAVQSISSYKVLSKVAVKSLTANLESGQNIKTPIKLTASGVGGKAPYTYKFYYIHEDSTISKPINSTYSSATSVTFVPQEAGRYTLHVLVRDANGEISENDKEVCILDYEVVDYPIIKSFTADQSSGIYVETPVNLTATVDGGTEPYHYKFTSKLGSGAETEIENTDFNETVEFTPTKAGTYTLSVYVTDDDGNPKPAAKKEIRSFVVYDELTVKSFTTSATTISKGKGVTFKATATGGQPSYQYMFYTDKANPLRGFSSTSYYTWKPATPGTYTVYVDIKDKKGTVETSQQPVTVTVN
jgi:hypothetical protein